MKGSLVVLLKRGISNGICQVSGTCLAIVREIDVYGKNFEAAYETI